MLSAPAGTPNAVGVSCRVCRRCASGVLLLGMLACLPALLLGSAAPAPALRDNYGTLQQCWGPAVARAWARGTLLLLPTGEGGGPCGETGCALLARIARLLPAVPAAMDLLRAWPLQLAGHLWALALWLGLLQPLAWSLLRWRLRQQGVTGTCGLEPRPGQPDSGCTLVGPLLVLTTLAWIGLPAGGACWAPGLAGAWLALRSWNAVRCAA